MLQEVRPRHRPLWAVPFALGLCNAALQVGALPDVLAHEAITTELTWTRNISRIFYNRCATCHRQGGAAPMPLTTYEEVRPWAVAVKHEVLTRRMPPWGAVKGFGMFRNDASLSLPEIALISSWVQGGAPEGDSVFLEPFHLHEQGGSDTESADSRLAVRGSVRLDRPIVATGVSAGPRAEEEWLQLTAHEPDGAVEHLIWLRGPRPKHETDYWFLREISLRPGTKLRCKPEGATVDLRYRPSPAASGP